MIKQAGELVKGPDKRVVPPHPNASNPDLSTTVNNLETLSNRIHSIIHKHEQVELYLEGIIKSANAQLNNVMKHWRFRFNENVLTYQKNLEVAKLYKDRSDATLEDLIEISRVLETHRAQLDKDLEEWTKKEVEKWSKEIGYIRRIQPEPLMFRTFKVADVLDFEQVAKDFDKALKRGVPEDIYRELHALQWEPEAIDKLDKAYRRKYYETLETAFKDRFGGVQEKARLKYALQLINKGKIIESLEPLPSSFEEIATYIDAELAKPTVEPENIYAALTPFRRNTELLWKLNASYEQVSGTPLQTQIRDKLKGDPKAKDYALYLIGDPTMEKTVRSCKEAVHLQKALSELTFDRDDGVKVPVPHDSPLNSEPGAHIICQTLKEIGYASKKIFAHSLCIDETGHLQPNLHVHNYFAPDMTSGQGPTVTLRFHVAPLIQVETPCGVRELVQDPSLSDRALTVKNWVSKMSQDTFERISLEEYKAKLELEDQLNVNFSHLADKTYVFTTSRNYFFLPTTSKAIEDLEASYNKNIISDYNTTKDYKKYGKSFLINNANRSPYNRIAYFIRKNMYSINDDVSAEDFLNGMATDFLKNVSIFCSISNTDFSSIFPKLYQCLRTHIAKTKVSSSISNRFENLLSGNSMLSGPHGNQHAFSARLVHGVRADIALHADQQCDVGKSKDAKGQAEDYQKDVDQWPLETIYIERIHRPIFFRDFAVADVLDFEQLANDFEDAKSGERPENIYRILQALQREQKAIDQLNWEYLQKTGQTLERALQDYFEDGGVSGGDSMKKNEAQLEYALQLITKGKGGTEQVVESRPPIGQEFNVIAWRIYQALHPSDGVSKPENVYAALTPLERNTEFLCKLDEWYTLKFEISLKSDIEKNLEEKSKEYALYLIGDQIMEKEDISEYEAMCLTKALFPEEKTGWGGHTFDRGDGVRVPVPYDHPTGGCQYRAHTVCELLKEMGYTSEKVYTSSYRLNELDQKVVDLRFRTDLAPDMPDGEDPTITWGYHIASCIQVKTASGVKQRLVLDPSLDHRPLTVEKWMKDKLGQASYEPIELDVYQTKLTEGYLKNPIFPYLTEIYILIASRTFLNGAIVSDSIENGRIIPGQLNFEAFKDEGQALLINSAKWVPYNRMARSIREELRKHRIKNAEDADTFLNTIATNFLADVTQFRSGANCAFSSAFLNLYKDLIAYVKTRVCHPSDNSMSDFFCIYLSGEARNDQKFL